MSNSEEERPRRTRAPGERSRRRVLHHAAQLATVEGLEGLSVGRLAEASGMPKSSVYQLFGSKEEIQLATVEAARATFTAEVVLPARVSADPGAPRLLALCDGYLDYVENRVFPGGCFFVGAAAEVGARPGRLHDRVAVVQQEWRDLLLREAERAAEQGELPDGSEPAQVAFELGAIVAGTNILSVLHEDFGVIARARAAVRSRLGL
ncbi:TetR/AcrR family transcriptional regulator [Microbacterium capsulatum]|uniref:TetR/AcrR family transcriptional regulator n=1 Tax=Microbacterium capsulatum TaxID=3041921 RepID=A0ABU0XL18_9MICO|nr:TetR/AcrR family transcriptional regulator [Microbacterium sp. ASV81]MDQ4215845.1 TetR/AcrR family transcriptional regulator [Microbacterium sp. ASV81]